MQPIRQNMKQWIKGFSAEFQLEAKTDSDVQLAAALVEDQAWSEEQQKAEDQADEYLASSWKNLRDELEAKREELHALATDFHSHLPPDIQNEVTNTPRSFQAVINASEKLRSSWETRSETNKFAKARMYMRKVGTAISNHSNFLKILPSSNDYMSVFCGALTVLITASSNYEKLSEGFARAVAEINDCVATVHEEVLHHRDDICMQHLVLRLYCLIFSFLIHVVKWYTDRGHKRGRRSLNESLYDHYQEQLREIRRLSEMISRRVNSRDMGNLRDSVAMLHQQNGTLRFLLELQQHDLRKSRLMQYDYFEQLAVKIRNDHKEEMRHQQEQFQRVILERFLPEACRTLAGVVAREHLEIAATEFRAQSISPVPAVDQSVKSSAKDSGSLVPPEPTYTRSNVVLHSAHLAESFNDQRISPYFTTPGNSLPSLLANAEVVARIQSLTVSPTSSILHVCTPWELGEETEAALIASRYAAASRAAGVSVVSFFCSLERADPPEGRTRETMALVALGYAVIRQLVELLPESEEENEEMDDDDRPGNARFGYAEFGPARFAALDGTLRTWDAALELLRDLFSANDEPLLYMVIDGVHLLDDVSHGSTREALGKFVALLRRVVEEKAGRYLVKILFTTAGQSTALNEVLDGRDVITVSKPVGLNGVGRSGRRLL
ncbi:hypothetical protein B0J12DRAFT_787205 [Macrophomina phaseolina]|uniref:DUF7708 domain-containing protein n=1 Tax=Macrophomina phaseolina TaxID=35725 RepID=A0ABQ8G5T0_9PEZI|nr:hypothetical protein B0J12DRAFT_787205 [Macrophomina phaseolina]